MKKGFWKQLIQIIIAILTAISSTLFVQSCVKSTSSSSTAPQRAAISVSPMKCSRSVMKLASLEASATTTTLPMMDSSGPVAPKKWWVLMPATTMPTASASAMKVA